jgi:hypothetical protein
VFVPEVCAELRTAETAPKISFEIRQKRLAKPILLVKIWARLGWLPATRMLQVAQLQRGRPGSATLHTTMVLRQRRGYLPASLLFLQRMLESRRTN